MRALFSVVLILTLLLAGCGGGESSGDEPVIPAGIGGSDSSGSAASGSATSETAGTAVDGAGASATPTLTRMLVQPSRTPRPTSTPFPTATPVSLPPTSTETSPDAAGSTGTAQPDATETPLPAPTVDVISTNIFRNPDAGSAIIFGEVQNTGEFPATGVIVTARLFNANGDRVGRGESESVGKTVMNPGDIAGFSIIITFDGDEYVEWASEEIVTEFNLSRSEIIDAYTAELSVSDDQLVPPATGFDFVDVAGNLTNDSGKTLRFVQVGATAYDADGNVISVDSFVTTEPLEPGAIIPFSVEFSRGRLKDFPASYAFVVEGLAE